MKSRYYLTGVWIVGMGTLSFLAGWNPRITIGMIGFGILLLLPLLFFSAIWNLIAVFKFWKFIRFWSLLPLGLLVLSHLVIPSMGKFGLYLRVQKFKGQIAEYEKLAAVVLRKDQAEMDRLGLKVFPNSKPGSISNDLPDEFRRLAWSIRVESPSEDRIGTVIFVYAGGSGHHYAAYIYRPDGDISNTLRRLDLHLQAPINENWCAAGR